MRKLAITALLLFSLQAGAGVVQPLGAHYQLLIPAAGNVPGAFGTNFRSDITILNMTAQEQVVRLEWLSQNGTSNLTRYITLFPSTGIRSANFVNDYLLTTGLGSIVVTAMTAEVGGTVDTTGLLYVSSRIWTPQASGGGTNSQSFPVIPVTTIDTPSASMFAVGGGPPPDTPADYRVNVGVVNLAATPQTFAIVIPSSPTGHTVTLPPRSMIQVPMGSGLPPATQVVVQNTTAAATRSNNWMAYQSTVNNTTGDAWSELAVAGQ